MRLRGVSRVSLVHLGKGPFRYNDASMSRDILRPGSLQVQSFGLCRFGMAGLIDEILPPGHPWKLPFLRRVTPKVFWLGCLLVDKCSFLEVST